MVHIKRLELSHFKSFGGTTQVPLLTGFTVVSGPNGSGKSNILDALLFALGLASSKGMRAERLPDLVNHNQGNRGTAEASVTVTFEIDEVEGDLHEWSVTRKLRVTKQGTYTSNYYINGAACTLTELHEQLSQLRVYPEGYNVVLQGDVTGIISMNAKERREIIDELAGVANFDRKIVQAKDTLEEVRDRSERCQIVEKELITQRDRLSQDRLKAEKYQKLRAELHQKQQWEAVLVWRHLQQQQEQLIAQIQTGDRTSTELSDRIAALNLQIQNSTVELDTLNERVKALGEAELLDLQSTLANYQAEQRQLEKQQQDIDNAVDFIIANLRSKSQEVEQNQQLLTQTIQEQESIETQEITALRLAQNEVQIALEKSREEANAIADASEAWVQQQTALSRQIEALLQSIEPQRTEQAKLKERHEQLSKQIDDQKQLVSSVEPLIVAKQTQFNHLEAQLVSYKKEIELLASSLAAAEQELQIQQQTQSRLIQEQREKQRALDKLEAQTQAIAETQGTYATKVISQAGLSGVCGLVAQLGNVEPRYQLALETAAGGRLGQLVVEDDLVAAAAIELLKQKRAGRATFLPLNKIQSGRFSPTVALRYANGFIDYAINLIECDRKYQNIFAYVFGSTVVFTNLDAARSYLGQHRIVTLEGELLESSGAMTGGMSNQRSGLHFGTNEAAEADETLQLRRRLQDITQILERCNEVIGGLVSKTKHLAQELTETRQQHREKQLHSEQLAKEIQNLNQQLEQTRSQLEQTTTQATTASSRLQTLEQELPQLEAQLQTQRLALTELEESQTNSQWQQIQVTIRDKEQKLQAQALELRKVEEKLKDLENQRSRLQEKIQAGEQRIAEYNSEHVVKQNLSAQLVEQIAVLSTQISEVRTALSQVNEQLQVEKEKRDRFEQQLKEQRLTHQQLQWQKEKLEESQISRKEELGALKAQLQTQSTELPEPLPEVPSQVELEQLQVEMRSLTKKLEAMEPVNMLALEEYERTNTRLEELTQKLETLAAERTEILLRIENFTTLRQTAFKEAFDAVNENFQSIFATLSEGDGYLQLENPEEPFNGGLNLVAHPKGKPVQRLASMSGGEKSLTALSFIFALQRYRPSPFYAFDEVDMFLDGANVERLAKMIKHQATLAQFIVVSLRRPMIESAERTIGVTQARGAYTQVLGIKL
ncbi:chromosome segregation protein SMC [Aliterella atlantica]|uniref:Chromosome partition protein Smc n=1 Tax=Aliterella atlantica CENA595 TaxID=1618023 RepID=A0A0D8ZM13_9CYAN|nr:chromosome segregation protein SMC [Aliterella atlantica]KJH69479.1 chromosome segregation protein SMC [Aliterella atlantica CENA595]